MTTAAPSSSPRSSLPPSSWSPASLPRVTPRRLLAPAPLLALLALWLIATLGWRPLLLPDEGRYAEVARMMMRSGEWGVPRLDGLPFFHKPPLLYWLDIAAMRVFGETAFAARFGAMLGAWLMGAALLFTMRRWHGERTAAIALAMLATTPYFFFGAQYVNHDMLVAGLITAAVLAVVRAVDATPKPQLGWLVAAWTFCGLALLAKGLIGIVLPGLVIVPWLAAQRRWRALVGLLHPLGLVTFVAVAAPWCIAMQLRYPGFFDYFFIEQHFRRYAESGFNNHHGAWFFFAVLPLATLPWSAWLPAAWRHARGHLDARTGLCLWWVVAVVGFFSIPVSKMIGYVMPALAPWCALLALAVAARWPAHARPRAPIWAIGAAVFFCVGAVAVATWKPPSSNRAVALALAERMAPDDAVVMVDAFFYDVPFYARLARPAIVASRWDDPDLPKRDNWRKELFDAVRFDPELGRALLQPLARLDASGCGNGTVWFIARKPEVPLVARLSGAVPVFDDRRTELWQRPARACP